MQYGAVVEEGGVIPVSRATTLATMGSALGKSLVPSYPSLEILEEKKMDHKDGQKLLILLSPI
ncbi:MAG: hypothetical protein IPH36_19715 [Saprospiraceae bacterium]|nr:hypothetical protein [Saprospiraceae bacterium]